MSNYVFTSESVAPGHPDKLCDQISDALLDFCLAIDPFARCAFECFVTKDNVIIGGEVRLNGNLSKQNIENVARQVIRNVGYDSEGFSWQNTPITILVHEQSPDIAIGVDAQENKDEGAGDQGIMFGYACTETEDLMPMPINYCHKILENVWQDIKNGKIQGLGPDAKTQISINYQDEIASSANSVTLSIQHHADISIKEVRNMVLPIIERTLPKGWLPNENRIFINPTGRFVIGGPVSDTGLTGRKIIVDTYGGSAPHGGGAFSGKDPTKVDRSAAYMARFLSKNIVAAGLAKKALIQLSYVIGISEPTSIYIDFYGTQKPNLNQNELIDFIKSNIPLTTRGIREYLNLNRPIYQKTATFGHFGRKPLDDGSFSWEKTTLADKFRSRFLG